jgi:glycosyltransferase involved in cell wall biosynthesis
VVLCGKQIFTGIDNPLFITSTNKPMSKPQSETLQQALNPPRIPPVASVCPRPFWSVVIPTFNPRKDFLEKTLSSVLSQNLDASEMEIVVVDDCSSAVDVEAMVRLFAGDRLICTKTPQNLGLAGCWNASIELARGRWVHILHQDDYILPGFYERLRQVAQSHPGIGLIAARSFFVNEEGIIDRVTRRVPTLEPGSRRVNDFLYNAPVQCPGVVVRRDCYEAHGGFRSDLVYALDVEMWARITGLCGGVIVPDVLACYRESSGNQTSFLKRSAETLKDIERLQNLYKQRYSEFDAKWAKHVLLDLALRQAGLFKKFNDPMAATASIDFWKKRASTFLRIRYFVKSILRAGLQILPAPVQSSLKRILRSGTLTA